jgi:nickel-dependent lactate racemase
MVSYKESAEKNLSQRQVLEVMKSGIPESIVRNKKVLVLTPDATRTCPLPLLVRSLHSVLQPLAKTVDYMVALGSHSLLGKEAILELYGIERTDLRGDFQDSRFLNHRWDLSDTLTEVGRFSESEIGELTGGLFGEEVAVSINRAVFDYDLLLILGPVFPHEVVGFSGGSKYLFPGISGGEFLHFFHWLAAVVGNWNTIGIKDTAVRRLLTRAAGMVGVPKWCVSVVVTPENTLAGIYAGELHEAWAAAADLSNRLHVVYTDRPFLTVLGKAPDMYDEVWVAGKVMYKLEPIVADGGRLIIYGPHIKEISRTWGSYLERTGYHVRDYYLKQMAKFAEVPRAALAHSVLVKGLGTYENGIEKARIEVVLATSIPESLCHKINLGYLDPDSIHLDDYRDREREGVLFVDHAGETLHRVRGSPVRGGAQSGSA